VVSANLVGAMKVSSQDTESRLLEGKKKVSLGGTVNKQLTAVITLASRNEIHYFELALHWRNTRGCLHQAVDVLPYHRAGTDLSQNTGNKRI